MPNDATGESGPGESGPGESGPGESDVVWNVIFTPGTFRYFVYFTRSLLAMSDARVRVVANGCPPGDVAQMRSFAARHAERVDAIALPDATMVPHGVALNTLYAKHDDGDYFCFVDSDVKATERFMPRFLEALPHCATVTSCKPAWTDDTTLPVGSRDLAGRHVVDHDGFVYGSSYLAMYRRDAVDAVRARWPVTFEPYAHTKLPENVQDRLVAMGRGFNLYDTAKVLNILMQGEGYAVRYVDHPGLFHIGGISQYVSHDSDAPPLHATTGKGRERWGFARWAAATLMALIDGRPGPAPGDDIAPSDVVATRRELEDLATRYATDEPR